MEPLVVCNVDVGSERVDGKSFLFSNFGLSKSSIYEATWLQSHQSDFGNFGKFASAALKGISSPTDQSSAPQRDYNATHAALINKSIDMPV